MILHKFLIVIFQNLCRKFPSESKNQFFANLFLFTWMPLQEHCSQALLYINFIKKCPFALLMYSSKEPLKFSRTCRRVFQSFTNLESGHLRKLMFVFRAIRLTQWLIQTDSNCTIGEHYDAGLRLKCLSVHSMPAVESSVSQPQRGFSIFALARRIPLRETIFILRRRRRDAAPKCGKVHLSAAR